ncbi:hypothetical protein GCM10028775_34230 [Catellatospora paridis]
MVTVVWLASEELKNKAFEVMAADPRHPLLRHLGFVGITMAEAIMEILRSAGLDAHMSTDDLSPGVVEVFASVD